MVERDRNLRKNIDMSARPTVLDTRLDLDGDNTVTLRELAFRYIQIDDKALTELAAASIVRNLKKEPDGEYGDTFNRLVCTNLDKELALRSDGKTLEATAQKLRRELASKDEEPNLLKWSEKRVRAQIQQGLTEKDLEECRNSQRETVVQELLQEVRLFTSQFARERGVPNKEQVSKLETLWVLTNIAQPYPFKERYARKSLLGQLASSVFRGKELTTTTLVCMSYIHEPDSRPGTVRVTPGPIQRSKGRDNDDVDALGNFSGTVEIYRKFLGARVKAYAILSDIDFIDVFKVSDPEALDEAKEYYKRYRALCENIGLIPLSFIKILATNPAARELYEKAKGDISQNIQEAIRAFNLKSPRFYYNIFYINESAQSIFDYYNGLPGTSMSWETAYQNTIDKLLVYGSQPEVLRTLFPRGYTFVSSEAPVRDAMYLPRDKALKKEKMPIMYPFLFVKQEK